MRLWVFVLWRQKCEEGLEIFTYILVGVEHMAAVEGQWRAKYTHTTAHDLEASQGIDVRILAAKWEGI